MEGAEGPAGGTTTLSHAFGKQGVCWTAQRLHPEHGWQGAAGVRRDWHTPEQACGAGAASLHHNRHSGAGLHQEAMAAASRTVEGVGLDKAAQPHALVSGLPLQPPAVGRRVRLRRSRHALGDRQAHGAPRCRVDGAGAGRQGVEQLRHGCGWSGAAGLPPNCRGAGGSQDQALAPNAARRAAQLPCSTNQPPAQASPPTPSTKQHH